MSTAPPSAENRDTTPSRSAEVDLFSLAGDGILQQVSEDFACLLGLSPEDINGRSLLELVHPRDTPNTAIALSGLQDGGPPVTLENRFITRDEGVVHVEWVARQVSGTDAWRVAGRDTTEFHRLRAQISELEARLDLVVGHGTAALWDFDARQGHITWDAHAGQILGVKPAAVPATVAEFAAIVHEEDRESVFAALAELMETGEFELEVRGGQVEGAQYLSLLGRITERDHRDRPLRAVGLALDITAEKALEEQLRQKATTDALTGVPNRGAFNEALQSEARRCSRELEPLSVIMVDIDNFKIFNDTYGHLAGDAALIAVARSLNASVRRAGDLLARFGGEEFAMVLPKTDEPGALAVAERLVLAVRAVSVLEAPGQDLSVSVGTATWRPGESDLDALKLLGYADQALYAAKLAGKDRAVAHSSV